MKTFLCFFYFFLHKFPFYRIIRLETKKLFLERTINMKFINKNGKFENVVGSSIQTEEVISHIEKEETQKPKRKFLTKKTKRGLKVFLVVASIALLFVAEIVFTKDAVITNSIISAIEHNKLMNVVQTFQSLPSKTMKL